MEFGAWKEFKEKDAKGIEKVLFDFVQHNDAAATFIDSFLEYLDFVRYRKAVESVENEADFQTAQAVDASLEEVCTTLKNMIP